MELWQYPNRQGSVEFLAAGKTVFELPIAEISNAIISAKNEITIELGQHDVPKKHDSCRYSILYASKR